MKREDIIRYAYERVPFYSQLRNKARGDGYPVIDKHMILNDTNRLFSPEYFSELFADKLERVFTSGSTGDCLEILWRKDQNIRSLLPLWNMRKKYYGILPNHRRCHFFITKIKDGQEIQIEESKYALGFCKTDLSEEKVLSIYKKMELFAPEWMIIQPSMLAILMKVIKKFNCSPLSELRYIEITGECMPEDGKREAASFFGCQIASQYGCYEVNSIAYECPCGNMHVMKENVFVEIVNGDEICVTSLHNRVMPFIRYKVGDRGRIDWNVNCACGNRAPVLYLNKARDNDYIIYKDGTIFHSDILYGIVERINLLMERPILQYQIVQEDYEYFLIYIVLDDEEDAQSVEEMFKRLAKDYHIKGKLDFFFVDYLFPSEKTGKLAWFCSKMKGDGRL